MVIKSKSLVAWGQDKGDRDGQEEGVARMHKWTFGSDGYIYYFDCHNSFMNVSVCKKLLNGTFQIHVACYMSHVTPTR